MSMLYTYIALSCYNVGYLTYKPSSLETITDLDARIAGQDALFKPSDAVKDLPLLLVNEVLYD